MKIARSGHRRRGALGIRIAVAMAVVVLACLVLSRRRESGVARTALVPEQRNAAIEPSLTSLVSEATHARTEVASEHELIALRVLTSTARRNGTPVPNIHVEVGRGSMNDGVHTTVAQGITDARGEAVICVARSSESDDDKWWVRVAQEGFQRRLGRPLRVSADPELADPFRLVVEALPGATLTGKLVDESGASVWGEVTARRKMDTGVLGVCGHASANSTGRFELHTSCGGLTTLNVTSKEHGTGVLSNIDTSHSITDGSLVVVVRGRGVVRGRVNEASGAPASALEIKVLPEIGAADWGTFLSFTAEELAREGRGAAWWDGMTEADGSFEARGLREGRYFVFAHVGTGEDHAQLTELPVVADGAQHTFVIARPCIAVHVVDAQGEPCREPIDCGLDSFLRLAHDARWPQKPVVSVHAAVDPAARPDDVDLSPFGRTIEVGSFLFDVRSKCTYTVALLGGEFALQTREVRVEEGAGRIDVHFTVGAKPAFGVLEVLPITTNGQAASGSLSLRIEDPASAFPILEEDHQSYIDAPIRYTLPAGAYDVRVEGKTSRDHHHGYLTTARTLGSGSANAVVRANETSTVRPVIDAGGRLRVRLIGAADAADRAGVTYQRELSPEELDQHAARATLRLVEPGRWPTRVDFMSDPIPPSTESDEKPWLVLGSAGDSAILPCGAFELEARTQGGRKVKVPVVIRAGETTPIEVRVP